MTGLFRANVIVLDVLRLIWGGIRQEPSLKSCLDKWLLKQSNKVAPIGLRAPVHVLWAFHNKGLEAT